MQRYPRLNVNTPDYWDAMYRKENNAGRVRIEANLAAALARWLRIRQDDQGERLVRWLDVGCGAGAVIHHITETYGATEAVGLDFTEEGLSYARERVRARPPGSVNFMLGNAHDLSQFQNGAFDLVHCSETIEHLDDPEKAISEFARVTQEDGFVVLTTPYRYRNRDNSHVWEFEPNDYARWADKIGELVFIDCRVIPGWHSMFGVFRKSRVFADAARRLGTEAPLVSH
jgi:ubiquinone/menaquinone biosynthesis C-methylase UbiE